MQGTWTDRRIVGSQNIYNVELFNDSPGGGCCVRLWCIDELWIMFWCKVHWDTSVNSNSISIRAIK